MSLFDQLVDEAIQNRKKLASLRIVIEKELLHHDILRKREMQRFLPTELLAQTVSQTMFWEFLVTLMQGLFKQSTRELS